MGHRYTVSNALRILGVPVGAPAPVVRRAFRRLALQHHPDRNPGDPGAGERFRSVCDAYRFLTEQSARSAAPGAPESPEPTNNPFAPKPPPRYPSAFRTRRDSRYYPTPAEIADLDRPARFHPTKWLGLFCGVLLLGTAISAFLTYRSGGYVGPGKPWVQEFLKRTARRY